MTGTAPVVTPLPHPNRTLPPAPAAKTATLPAAPSKAAIQPIAPPKVATTAPVTPVKIAPPVATVKTAAPVAPIKTVAQQPAASATRTAPIVQARPPERVVPHQHQRMEPRHVAALPPRTIPHHQHQHRPQPHYYPQKKSSSGGDFLKGFVIGGGVGAILLGGLMNKGGRPVPQQSDYPQDDSRLGLGAPMHPAKFKSMMNAAIEGREDTRVNFRGEVLPTSREDRMMFKQVMFNMLAREGKPIDERAMFIPGILDDGRHPMPREERGTHITHFSPDFKDPLLGEMARDNYRLLNNQYAAEYRAYKDDVARQEPPRHQDGYGYQTSQKPLGFIKLFGA